MADQEMWQKMMKEERLRHQLELQSRQIEKVFSHHQLPAQVAGGQVQSRQIRFDLHAQIEAGVELLRKLKQDLLAVLGATLIHDEGGWSINVSRSDDVPVALLDIMPLLKEVPPVTAVLGLVEDGSPLLTGLKKDDLMHTLIAGKLGAGKTTLLRTIAISLAMNNRQHKLQLAIIAPSKHQAKPNSILNPLSLLPHMLFPIAETEDECMATLDFLVDELAYRLEQKMTTPSIIVLIDELSLLMDEGGGMVKDMLLPILQKGPEVGIHLIMTTEEPQSELMTPAMRASVPLRLVGQCENELDAKAGAGIGGTQAEYLLGAGDFLAVVEDAVVHFQAASIGDYDLHLTLDTLQRNRPRPVIAKPFNPKINNAQNDRSQENFYWFNESILT